MATEGSYEDVQNPAFVFTSWSFDDLWLWREQAKADEVRQAWTAAPFIVPALDFREMNFK